MFSVNLKEQKKVAFAVIFSVGFFIYGVANNNHHIGETTMLAKQVVKAPQRGIASE